MTYIICEPCVNTKDTACVDACPVDCIHPKKDEPDFEASNDAVHQPGGMHRLWRVRTGLPGHRDLPGRQRPGTVAELHSHELRALRSVEVTGYSYRRERPRLFVAAFLFVR